MITVDVQISDGLEVDLSSVRWAAERVLSKFDLPDAEMSVWITDDATIRQLNRKWRGKDRSTDVLSFSQREGNDAVSGVEHLGDVVISLETAVAQAPDQGHDAATEVRELLVHGICHLLGYDHETPEDADEMAEVATELLDFLAAAATSG